MKRGPRLALSIPTTCGPFQGGRFVTYLHRTPRSAKHSLVTLSRNRFDEITLNKSASIRQPHWHRHLDVKRPSRALEELRQVAAARTERGQYDQVDCSRISERAHRAAACPPGADALRDWERAQLVRQTETRGRQTLDRREPATLVYRA